MMIMAKRLLALTVSLVCSAPALAAPSPAEWPAAERAALEAREAAIWPTAGRAVESGRGLVSATASPIAVHAGVEVLRAGGSAADAAVATALTQVTTILGANVSFAGAAQLLYFDAKTRRVYAMDAGWSSWRGEASPSTIPSTDLSLITGAAAASDASGAPGRKVLVPGFMAGMAAMHDRFGRLPFGRLFEPAIWYARNGVPVTPLTAAYFAAAARDLGRTAEGRHFLMPAGALPKVGDRYASPQVAELLRSVAAHGAGEMYKGRWARDFVATVNAAGGHAGMADLAAYRVRWAEPVSTDVNGAQVFAPAEPNAVGCAMLAALNILGHAKTAAPYWEDARSFRTTALTLRLATLLGWSPEAGQAVQARLGLGGTCKSRLAPEFGEAAAGQLDALLGANAPLAAGHHSASVVVVDRWGNVAALVHSSNTPLWGDSGLVVDGVPIPAPAGLYRDALTRIAPGDRVPSDMSPLIALRGGAPVDAVATIGSSELQEAVRIMAGLLDGTGDVGTLLAAPPLLLNYEQTSGPILERDELVPPGRYSAALTDAVRTSGLPVREMTPERLLILRGTASVVSIEPAQRRSAEAPQVLEFAEGE